MRFTVQCDVDGTTWGSRDEQSVAAGSQPLQGDARVAALFQPPPQVRAAQEQHRRRVAQDLLAFSRMLTQLASGPAEGGARSPPQCRDSKLTAVRCLRCCWSRQAMSVAAPMTLLASVSFGLFTFVRCFVGKLRRTRC